MSENTYLKDNLRGIKQHIRKDFDWVWVVIGYEGMGKSTHAWGLCNEIDPDFNVKKVVFTFDELVLAMDRAKPYSAIMIDEGAEIFFNLNTTTKEGRIIQRKFMACRSKNLFYVICIPDFQALQRYMATHRISCLTRVIRRGVCEFYSKKRILKIRKDKNSKGLVFPKPNFFGKFNKVTGTEWERYLKKKANFQKLESSRKVIREKLKRAKQRYKYYTASEVASILGVQNQTIRLWIRSGYGGKKIFYKKDISKDIHGRYLIKKKAMRRAEKLILHKKNKI